MMLRTKSAYTALQFCFRQNIPVERIQKRQGWYYVPEKGQKFQTTMENRKLRPFEEQGHCK